MTSVVMNAKGDHFFVGTDRGNVYLVQLQSFEFELRTSRSVTAPFIRFRWD